MEPPENERRRALAVIQDRVAARAASIQNSRADWPCRRGCADCCRSLGDVPRATPLEWKAVTEALNALPPAVRRRVRERMAALSNSVGDPLVCPLLDDAEGACLVYAARPLACRTFGFYAARDGGRWCDRIQRLAETDPGVVWGNLDAVEADLHRMSEPVAMTEWFARRDPE